tara:strand:+ start:12830 stop:13297 length:468 start_codon:yes stop_codon:yes gene_type:complete
MKIKEAQKSDKNEFIKTQKEAFPNLDLKKQKNYFDLKIKNNEILIYRENGEYVGHLAFGHYLLNPPFAKSIFLEEIAIKKKFRGKGIATLLIKYISNYCKKKNIPMIYLGTGDYKKNKSIKLYKRLGFKKLGKLDDINPKSEYKYGQIFYGKVLK